MLFSRLLELEENQPIELLEKLDSYFYSLIGHARESITVTKLMRSVNIDSKTAMNLLTQCCRIGILEESYCLRCPTCETIIKRNDKLSDFTDSITHCYSCDEDFEISAQDIELVFKLVDMPIFQMGQQECKLEVHSPVAPENSLEAFLLSRDAYALLYKPTEHEYSELMKKISDTRRKGLTTIQKGKALEELTKYIFSICKGFTCGDIKTGTNQIDCYARNMVIPHGVFRTLGERFLIECKNENKTPKADYIRKIHSIIMSINAHSRIVGTGIIVSRYKGPKTYKQIAIAEYLAREIMIINLTLHEIEELVNVKGNLLEMLERKFEEIHTNATSNLIEDGIYNN